MESNSGYRKYASQKLYISPALLDRPPPSPPGLASPPGHHPGPSTLHPPVPYRETNSEVVHQPLPGRHQIMDLTSATIQFFAGSKHSWTKKQHSARYKLRHLLKFFATGKNLDAPLPLNIMEQAIELIGDFFFFGALGQGKVKFRWSDALVSHGKAVGATTRDEWDRVLIVMDQLYPFTHTKDEDRIGHIFGTLLHESAHAFLELYSCCYSVNGTCPDPGCRVDYIQNVGDTGHGIAWTQLTSYIEAVAKEHFDSGIDLGMRESWEDEFGENSRDVDEWDLLGCHWAVRQPIRKFLDAR